MSVIYAFGIVDKIYYYKVILKKQLSLHKFCLKTILHVVLEVQFGSQTTLQE